MSAPFRLGLIGGGRMGRTHLRALEGSDQVMVVAVAEPFEAAAAQLREQGLPVYPTVEEMFASSELDGVLIAVPTPQHIDTTGKYGAVHMLVCSQWDEAPPPLAFRQHSGGIYIDMGVHEIDQTLWLLGQDFAAMKAQAFPTTEDPQAENDVDSAQALVMLSGGTSTLVSLGRFYEGGDIVSVELFGSKGHTRFDVVSPETGEDPQLHALRLQAEAFARQARGAAPEGTTAEEAARVLELAHGLTEAAGIAVLGAS